MITQATAGMAPALAAMHAASFSSAEAWSAEAIASLLSTPSVSGIVHAAGGFMMLRSAGDEADILTLAVVPAARRRGIATALLDAVCVGAPPRLFLEVAEANQAAIALYTKLGFIRIGYRPNYYPGGAAALLLARGH